MPLTIEARKIPSALKWLADRPMRKVRRLELVGAAISNGLEFDDYHFVDVLSQLGDVLIGSEWLRLAQLRDARKAVTNV